jgi:hypothetical protein
LIQTTLAVLLLQSPFIAIHRTLEPQQGELAVLCISCSGASLVPHEVSARHPDMGHVASRRHHPELFHPVALVLSILKAGVRTTGNAAVGSGNVGEILPGGREDGDKRI